MEAYLAPTRLDDRDPVPGRSPYFHLTLLAKDAEGYRNLCRLSSIGYLEGFYYRPRIDREVLAAHSRGLAIGSACLHGEVAQHLLAGNERAADEAAGFYMELAGRDSFFVELMDHGLPEEKRILEPLAALCARTGAMPVATGDAHYLDRSQAPSHEVLLCVQTGKRLEDPNHMRFATDEFYLKSPDEMARLFSWLPECVGNSMRIAEACDFRMEKGDLLLPRFPIPEGGSMDSALAEVADSGLKERLGREPDAAETARLDFELGVIRDMGFPGYFLIVSELRRWALSQGIAMGPGRGSAAGSLVSFAAGITDVNPLQHGLSFERFLNPSRREMPDIDLDVCFLRRPEVIDHIVSMYGRRSVCQIVTFNRMKAKSSIRDVGRVMGIPLDEVDALTRLVSQASRQLGRAGEGDLSIGEVVEKAPEVKARAEADPRIAKLFEHCEFLEDLARNTSVHAAGVIIAPGELQDFVPLCKVKDDVQTITTQYEMKSLDSAGLLKLDVLGLRTVTVLQKAELLARRRDPGLDVRSLPLSDPETFAMLANGDTTGVFQLESSGMRDALRRIGVNSFRDITAAVAIFRPGSMDMIDPYARNKHGIENETGYSIRCISPELEDILSETYGIMIYQEQVMAIANRFAGMDMAEADILRKAMSKKNPEVMAKQRKRFIEGAVGRGVAKKVATEVFDLVEKFAGYGFNKSHAVCYAILAFRTGYLKAHFPAEFMAATLSSEIGNIERLAVLVEECRRMGVEVLQPSVNSGGRDFDVDEDGRIAYALPAIRNVGEGPAAAIVSERIENGPYTSLFDLCTRVDPGALNRRVLESLGGAGALDCLGGSRAQILSALDSALEYGARARQIREAGQMSLFCTEASYGSEPDEPVLQEAGEMTAIARLTLEKSLLGFYFSGHPLDDFSEEVAAFSDIDPGDELPAGRRQVRMAGVVLTRREIPSPRGNMAFVSLEGRTGSTEVLVFSDALLRCGSLLEPGSFVLLEGEITERRDERRLSVNIVYPMDRARKLLGAGVRIRIDASGLDEGRLGMAVDLLRSHPGSARVTLDIRHASGRRIRAESRSLRVDPDDVLLGGLREILGRESISLVAGRPLS